MNRDFSKRELTLDELVTLVKTKLMCHTNLLIDLKCRYCNPKYFKYIVAILTLLDVEVVVTRFESLPYYVRVNLLNMIDHDYFLL